MSELFFGGVAPVGTPLEFALHTLTNALSAHGYDTERIKLSDQLALFNLDTPELHDEGEFKRVSSLMDRGNEAKRRSGSNDVLARLAVAVASSTRALRGENKRGLAFVFRQLKHPSEVTLFRQVYDNGFHLIGINSSRTARLRRLVVEKSTSVSDACSLVDRDAHEVEAHGQRVRDTFHLSDVFINVTGDDAMDEREIPKQIDRFISLLFGVGIHTPTADEQGMFLAWATALRSSQLGRQVGASIMSTTGEVLAVGANEVPQGGGGQYSEESAADGRDHTWKRRDSSDAMKEDILEEILDVLQPDWRGLTPEADELFLNQTRKKLKHARVMNLTEFGRGVHAEMEAILSAGRVGISVRGATLYTTTFPCHNCTKHIVDAGIDRVVYIEPYPKSLARELHSDSIILAGEEESDGTFEFRRIPFAPFVGIGPRRYMELFSMHTSDGQSIRRKDDTGVPLSEPAGLRLQLRRDSYLEREAKIAASTLQLTFI